MANRCYFIPPHVLDHIAKVQAQQSAEPSPTQRSAVVSAQFRRGRRTAGALPLALPLTEQRLTAEPGTVPTGLTVPKPGTSGRLIHDDQNQWTFDVQFIRGEGDPAVPAQNANDAYDHLGAVRSYYKAKLGRDSIDNAGLNLVANVNFGVDFDNAFWDDTGLRMVFGNGSGTVFTDLTASIDVCAHELTHGVTQFSANLNYTDDQSGALNESFSDMIGSAIDAYAGGKDAGTHNWLIGDEIMAPDLFGEALRSMAEPGTAFDNPMMGRDPQPRDMSGYTEPADPHIMSGIPNRWFYLICTDIGIDAATTIMYQTLQNLWPNAKFADAAAVAVAQARILARNNLVPRQAPQSVRGAARQQGFW
ncbi:M4 family metallopeptidase [Nonomuraea rhizosphaerae]|uniref:M4 family metallopeptidase n=1 Tax=Nonomuraea rhizosphaerae TaxID=2665663 RepID=UPI001C5D8F6F|nr:M4 family metallopeptidase [Nonomuraea rhizosphaerae]